MKVYVLIKYDEYDQYDNIVGVVTDENEAIKWSQNHWSRSYSEQELQQDAPNNQGR